MFSEHLYVVDYNHHFIEFNYQESFPFTKAAYLVYLFQV